MPWKRGSEKAGKLYEAMRGEGMSKKKAAAVAVSKSGQPLRKKWARRKKGDG